MLAVSDRHSPHKDATELRLVSDDQKWEFFQVAALFVWWVFWKWSYSKSSKRCVGGAVRLNEKNVMWE